MFDADSPLPWRAALEGMLAESGADPDFIAQEVGFSSGAEMVDALIRVEPLKDAIERDTDRVMLERHGELTTPELVEQAANEAVHNLHLLGMTAAPGETNAELVVNPDTVLSCAITLQCLQEISRRRAQVTQLLRRVQCTQTPHRDPGDAREPA